MTDFKIAMLLVLPLMLTLWNPSVKALWRPKVRCWLVMMGASLITMLHQSIGFYIAIDLVAAALVLAYPVTVWQRLIAWLFITMASFSFGFVLHAAGALENLLSANVQTYLLTQRMTWIGWLQWLVLLTWGGHDLFRHYWPADRWNSDFAASSLER